MLLIVLLIIISCFVFVIAFGAPYLPTLKVQQIQALELMELKPGKLLLEPGCGDARVLVAAAKKGVRGVGYELNPIMYIIARVVTWRYRKLIKIEFGNFWSKDWPACDGIYIFILQKFMHKMHKKIIQSNIKNVKVVSYTFTIPDKKATEQKGALYLYKY